MTLESEVRAMGGMGGDTGARGQTGWEGWEVTLEPEVRRAGRDGR